MLADTQVAAGAAENILVAQAAGQGRSRRSLPTGREKRGMVMWRP